MLALLPGLVDQQSVRALRRPAHASAVERLEDRSVELEHRAVQAENLLRVHISVSDPMVRGTGQSRSVPIQLPQRGHSTAEQFA